MNTKIIILISVIIIILVLALIAGLIFYLYYSEEEEIVSKEDEFSIIKTEQVSFDKEQAYEIGTAEFIVYPPDFENFDFGYFEAYNKGEKVYASTPLYMIMDILAFEYKGKKYIILSDYSGGAHCCFEEYVFLLDDDLELIETLELGETTILEDSLIMEDDKLYIKIFDDQFAYFYTPYVTSYFFVQYLEVKDDELIINNSAFEEEYIQEAERCEDELEEQIEQGVGSFENYSPYLVCITLNYLLAGKEDLAWQKFESYSSRVPLDYYGEEVDLDQFKQDFIELY